MNRLFGSKAAKPKATLNDALGSIDDRVSSLDIKLSKINAELVTYQQKLSRMREGPGKQNLKQKAMKLLRQKRQIEQQKDQLENQSWNISQAQMTAENLKNTMVTVDTLKQTNKELKKTYGKIDVDKIEDLQEEMLDLIEKGNEIQETLGSSYSLPDDVSESELDAELEALGDEVQYEQKNGLDLPSYLPAETNTIPKFIDEEAEQKEPVNADKVTAS
ncbi:Vps60 protein [Saccharomycopsis crataegensis]|uniref:Vps60 protein n=1 Tax=Saccharomycopsis crataegensis TaxID=43959 RepID=A0AAV5QP96_9ASCO|nr:Vps60 protein [Saccharomycopsis crataegensis]